MRLSISNRRRLAVTVAALGVMLFLASLGLTAFTLLRGERTAARVTRVERTVDPCDVPASESCRQRVRLVLAALPERDRAAIRGPRGERGPRGFQGGRGVRGVPGRTGRMGPAGPRGVRGARGATGARGPQGFVGPRGPVGPAGPIGPVGSSPAPPAPAATPPTAPDPPEGPHTDAPPAAVPPCAVAASC